MKNLIMISGLTIWSLGEGCGGPAFSKTMEKYLQEGWNLYFISDEKENADCPYIDKEHNLLIKASPVQRLCQIRKLGLLFRWIDHRIANRRFYRCAENLIKKLEGETVVYAYEIFGVAACKKLSERYKLPLVTRFQGTILREFENNAFNHIRYYPHYQATKTPADLVIMTDDGTQGDQALVEIGNAENMLFVRNGLDLVKCDIPGMKEAFDREKFRKQLGIGPADTAFLTVSRLEDWKKVDRAIRGFAALAQKQSAVRLVIVGDGAEKGNLEKLAKVLDVEDRVVFTGAVKHEEVYRYMMACDVFVSLYDTSNVGNPLLEALCLGCCIVTLDVGDTRKIIQNEENGLLLQYSDLEHLGDIFGRLASQPELRERLGKAAGAYARENLYSWEERMEREYKLVDSLG